MNQNLADYTGIKGGANTLLYFGRKTSPEMPFLLEFGEGGGSNAYSVKESGLRKIPYARNFLLKT